MRSNGCCVGEVRMEVPLTWQDPSSLIRFPVMEADTDDIPPSPTPDPVTPSPFGAGTFFQRGFLDCAHEAIRFLTEEEGMSENNPVVVGLRQHLVKATPSFTPPRSPLSSSSQLQQGRYAPYTVSPRRNMVSGCAKREGDKLGTSLSLRGGSHQKCSATTAPFAQKMEHVIASDLISTDDLQGVLRCLESEQSDITHNPHQCTSLSLSSSTSSSSVVLQRMPTDIESCAIDEGKKDDWQSRSLDDSGISETECVELVDEVDGVDAQCASVCDLAYGVDTAATSADSVSVKFQDNADDSLPHSSDLNIGRGSCPTTERLGHENLPCETIMSTPNSSHSSPSGTSVLPVPVSHSISLPSAVPTIAANTVDSNPSSQLALLSSLSSGTHRLTSASADTSDPTASRIQSLASQILLLLQEEAYAQDYSDDENDDDDDDDDQTSDIGESDLELEEDFLDLEAEP